jgi:solute carrier family 25 oxoglutarate transporter 11
MLKRIYNLLICIYIFRPDGKPPGFATKAVLGMVAGTVGAFVGTPAEVI